MARDQVRHLYKPTGEIIHILHRGCFHGRRER